MAEDLPKSVAVTLWLPKGSDPWGVATAQAGGAADRRGQPPGVQICGRNKASAS